MLCALYGIAAGLEGITVDWGSAAFFGGLADDGVVSPAGVRVTVSSHFFSDAHTVQLFFDDASIVFSRCTASAPYHTNPHPRVLPFSPRGALCTSDLFFCLPDGPSIMLCLLPQ
jgi:hypothetical protein